MKLTLVPLFFVPLVALPAVGSASRRPNILLIMPDQMRGDCMSCREHPVVRTPVIDTLASDGALFTRAYSTVPSCIPARYALLTGLAPQTSGVVGFFARPMPEATLPQVLNDAGYMTVLVGRNMHQMEHPGHAHPHEYQKLILGSTYVSDDDYDVYLKAAAPDTGGIKNLVNEQLAISCNLASAKPWPLADELHPTAWVAREARTAVADAPSDQPLFLTASFYAPHPPLFPPVRYFDAVRQRRLPRPVRGEWVDWDALPPVNTGSQRIRLEGELLRDVQAGYFGLIEHIDDQIAPLIDDFKKLSEQSGRPWVIVFTSDHGEMLGDHGYFRKCEPYEGSANIPFIIAASPDLGIRAGLHCPQPVCLEDIMPTLLDFAGARSPTPVDGVSLVPTLRGESTAIRDWLHSEHSPTYGKDQAFHALTDGHVKYIWRPTCGAEQLFNLDSDPHELRDLSCDPDSAKVRDHWRAILIRRLAGRPEGFTDGTQLIPGRPYGPQRKPRQPDKEPR